MLLVKGSERVEVFDHGSYIIDPTSKSLIIPNANEALLAGEYVCEAENIFDKDNLTYTASIIPDTSTYYIVSVCMCECILVTSNTT